MRAYRLLFHPDGDGAGAGAGEENGEANGKEKKVPTPEERAAAALAGNEQNITSVLVELFKRIDKSEAGNARYRERARIAEEKFAAAEDKLPDGAQILNAEQAEVYRQYTDLGTVKELRKVKREHADQGERLARMDRESAIDALKEVNPSLNTDALKTVVRDQVFEVKEKTEKGKKVKEILVRDGDSEPVTLDDYVDEHWKHLKAALFDQGARAAASLGTPRRDQAPQRALNGSSVDTGEVTQESMRKDLRSLGVGSF